MSASRTDGGPPAARHDNDTGTGTAAGAGAAPRAGDDGFTLVETLVALAVFALAFSGLYRAFDGGWQSLRRAQLEAEAIEVAKSQLAATGVVTPLMDGRQSGETADGVRWQIEIRLRGDGRQLPGAPVPRATAYDVSVTAGHAPRAGVQSTPVIIKTIKLGERPQ